MEGVLGFLSLAEWDQKIGYLQGIEILSCSNSLFLGGWSQKVDCCLDIRRLGCWEHLTMRELGQKDYLVEDIKS